MLVIAPIFVGLFGIVVERVIIRPLYGRTIETMLATWGLSFSDRCVSRFIGYYQEGAAPPLAAWRSGISRLSLYVVCHSDHSSDFWGFCFSKVYAITA